jgi:hypothetical protein
MAHFEFELHAAWPHRRKVLIEAIDGEVALSIEDGASENKPLGVRLTAEEIDLLRAQLQHAKEARVCRT